ncbi:lycopene cyclase domain-containing protein [Adhaeribacter radiodurans]|uniref:Lycopene cyclase domain-containing protein n=1 Tax=Adhaeribacter radiodurans TaxID=2745197 RepID=A0A7L7L9K1_9BACT|nr:lycopene cyclase domain-containing protein [Adhaeribacter radiodurans]QMU29417.1 lycopene cyclase domain-containing protein [Adhaeribacter radiodurans]
MYIYLYLNIFTILFPFLLSFDKRVQFYKNWKYLFPAIAINALIFIVWDSIFTQHGVWGFNNDYLLGIYFFNLPLEEVLFFITVPYACVFIYECLNVYVKRDLLQQRALVVTILLAIFISLVGLLHLGKLYTSVTFLLLPVIFFIHYLFFKDRLLGRFYLAYLVHLVPFLLVNGVLTSLPVVWYNNGHNLGIRLTTIPIEDTMYSMVMLLITITAFEFFRRRQKQNLPLPKFV